MKSKNLANLKNFKLKNKSLDIYKSHQNILVNLVEDYRAVNQSISDLEREIEIEIIWAICRVLNYFVIILLVGNFF